ncbi:Isocitrate dehydrogenase [NADP] [Rubripirellula lacrimiformis]|uniref:Isocitrate dehydrogenase [NADP] n=1 Tax=Rubripirellula lacrimiformis TaxID=1930273 RepID=A0A517NAL5_9BACT|nr:NADP-dependent isocitrate dehydrogenase [Rubripirellula lacrimiformis]QDT04170.1 Isocitrate dehydrogenase [NADP] [Rubripirellula lacrimiformis]
MSDPSTKIIYTYTDEAPALATHSLLPIVGAYCDAVGVKVETRDISLAARILANLSDHLSPDQQRPDSLAELGELAKSPEANIIKLPNISASIPQLNAAISELQSKGFPIPDFPDDPQSDQEKTIRGQYAKVLGSAVNPVLREGNSDRRVAAPVKEYARKHPHSMGSWSSDSKTHVDSMADEDFYGSEKSHVMETAGKIQIKWIGSNGETAVLKDGLALLDGEVIDASVMSKDALRAFLASAIDDAKKQDVLFSLHMKATMMKVSDPIIFGHCVSVFYADVFEKHAALFDEIGVDPSNGIGDVYDKIQSLDASKQAEVKADIEAVYAKRPSLAMVDSDKGITNLHVPSDVIIDASMPAAIRSSGKMWGADGKLHDMKAVIPDRCYAGIYQATIDFCKANGAFDVTTMGSVANVGLMAQKAEEYGSHDKTFEIAGDGKVQVIDPAGNVLMEHEVRKGDVWRMCQTKDIPIRDWVRLAVARARATGSPAIFWLDENRAHDANLIQKVTAYLPEHDTDGLEISIMSPNDAATQSCQRAKDGKDTISVTGNVLRDYLTDLFPILELGTSAKMLSIVPLLAGGGLFETGAGGSAPKHVQQLVDEGHLRWDSLGEFLAIAVSLEDLAEKTKSADIQVLASTLNSATSRLLDENKSPGRKVGELDNRGSHFYLALYWSEALAAQSDSPALQSKFSELAKTLAENESKILEQLSAAQGKPTDLGGYYLADESKIRSAMRPSGTLNAAIETLAS